MKFWTVVGRGVYVGSGPRLSLVDLRVEGLRLATTTCNEYVFRQAGILFSEIYMKFIISEKEREIYKHLLKFT